MKSIIAVFLTFALSFIMLSGGSVTVAEADVVTEQQKTGSDTYTPPTDSASIAHPLDGKKFIFIGNSYTYYGKCVLSKPVTNYSQSERSNDQGYFYQIAKENGADINVTNWTFGNHCLEDTFGGVCEANRACDGHDHAADLKDRYYDYVMFQESSLRIDGFLESVDTIMAFFRQANPNVKFYCLVPVRLYEWQSTSEECRNVLNNLTTVEKLGVTVVNWGKLVYDVYNGTVKVPGSELTYNRHSFIISQSASDGHHQNMLAGYITALMTWCAVTGDSAVGQEYRFTGDPTVNSAFDFAAYRKSYYSYGNVKTNFDQALQSKTEVTGFQQLINKYLADRGYRPDVAITDVVLKPGCAGIYFKGSFALDTNDDVSRYGIALSVYSDKPRADDTDANCLWTEGTNSALVSNILSSWKTAAENKENGKMVIYARAYALLKNGSYTYSDVVEVSLQQVVVAIDKQWNNLTAAQKEAVGAMYNTFSSVISDWNVPNIRKEYA